MNLFDKKFVHFMWSDELEGKRCIVSDNIDIMIDAINNGTYHTAVINRSRGGGYALHSNENGLDYRIAYYDPNYECKVAYEQGKQIQYKSKDLSEPWIDCTGEPYWSDACEYRVKPEKTLYVYTCSDDTLHINSHCTMPGFMFEGTEEECKQYIKEHYCSMCVHQSCDMVVGTQFCKGFKEPRRKRRMTHRELAKWIAQGNGQAKNIYSHTITSRGLMYDEGDDDEPCSEYLVIRGWDETEWSEPLIEE